MQHLLPFLQSKFQAAIKQGFETLLQTADLSLLEPEMTPSTQEKFGHYQCNNALKLGKLLGKNPREVAQIIIDRVDRTGIASLEIAGPGFINITLALDFLAKQTEEIVRDDRLGIPLPVHKKRVIVEFSSPNIAKELHVGHLRSTIIGDALARVFEFLGYDVLRLNHIGDWGTQFGMLIAFMKEEAPLVLAGKESVDLPQLMQWYRAAKIRFDADADFKKKSQLEVVQLQGGNPSSYSAWQVICDISRKAFHEIYDLLDVKLIERGESFYNPDLPQVIIDLEKKGLITISDGAKCVFLEGFAGRDGSNLPMIVQKSDGGYNYDTTDMAALRHRVLEERADRIIYVTDAGQSLHFAMLFKAAEKVGYFDPAIVQIDHVPFGVVLGQDGKKFKTRSGDVEKLIDLLLEAIERARAILQERLPDLSKEELEEMARILGIDAIKYADLSGHRIKDYEFSYERMLRFEGNTAAFLLYAFVRIQGIRRKIGASVQTLLDTAHLTLEHPTEVALALHLCRFSEVLMHVAKDLLPHRLSDYLYELAERFHAFFRDCRVEGSDKQGSRLLLCEGTSRTLETGLHLLGLKTLMKM